MLDATESIKITDFGLAIYSVDPSTKFIDTPPSGTPIYMPPEQFLEGTQVDERSDIYSFGIILYEMISGGNLPFSIPETDPLNNFDYFYNLHLSYKLHPFDSPLCPLVAKCLSKKPEDRYQSFLSISAVLKSLYKKHTREDYHSPSKEEMHAAEHINYSTSYMLLQDPQRALQHIDEALSSAPGYMLAYNNRAAILAELGRVDEAVKIWNFVAKKAPDLGRTHYNLGNVAMQNGDTIFAIKKFQQAIELEPDYIPAIVNLAICYQNIGEIEQSFRLYDQALEISPNNSQLIYNKAFLLYENENYSEAKSLFSEVVTLNPQNVSALNYLGLCHQADNQPESALQCFDKALFINPNYSYAKKNKSMLLQSIKKRKGFFGKLIGNK
jgi:tetratricopeptide (TPR) repeat protein